MNKDLYLDIETQPLEHREIAHHFPEKGEPQDIGPFNPDDVKIGNLKDKQKIDAKIESARLSWEEKRANQGDLHEQAWLEQCNEILDKAALSPVTGRVFGAGWKRGNHDTVTLLQVDPDPEQEIRLIESILMQLSSIDNNRVFGWNVINFDLKFIIGRAVLLGVRLPFQAPPRFSGQNLIKFWGTGNFGPQNITVWDLQAEFHKMGLCKTVTPSLDKAAKILGLESKVDLMGMKHHEFYKFDSDLFEKYFIRDLELCQEIAERLQFIQPDPIESLPSKPQFDSKDETTYFDAIDGKEGK